MIVLKGNEFAKYPARCGTAQVSPSGPACLHQNSSARARANQQRDGTIREECRRHISHRGRKAFKADARNRLGWRWDCRRSCRAQSPHKSTQAPRFRGAERWHRFYSIALVLAHYSYCRSCYIAKTVICSKQEDHRDRRTMAERSNDGQSKTSRGSSIAWG